MIGTVVGEQVPSIRIYVSSQISDHRIVRYVTQIIPDPLPYRLGGETEWRLKERPGPVVLAVIQNSKTGVQGSVE